MKKTLQLGVFFCFVMLCHVAAGASWKSSVAVVVDKTTYSKAKASVDAYVQSISLEDKVGILIVDRWNNPDSIRAELKRLYNQSQLEGAVLVGDIPIPMIRDAHHLTTAFKMNPKRDWKESSVPSDRFYDDFDLKFDYIKRDKEVALYHYYSLRADSPQAIHCDIYSARIKAPAIPGKDKYEAVAEFLNKAAAAKSSKKKMAKILYASGHGYNSNSMNARVDEAWSLKEQFPFLNAKPETDLDFIDYTFDDYVKYRLMGALANPALDLAILHHHGAEDTQFLNGSPISSNANTWIEQTQKFFRSKIRSSKDTAQSKEYYIKNYNVPASWVANAFDPKVVAADSLSDASININIPDLHGYKPGAKMIVIDACFNGSYHLEDYISAHYIFNEGSTLIVKANSVNTLQDTWTNEHIGLMNLGVCAGNWTKGQMTLESHLIGDPTFSFTSETPKENIDAAFTKEKGNRKYWESLYKKSTYPDAKTLALKMLFDVNAITTNQLLDIQKKDKSPIVRLEAFMLIKRMADGNLPAAIILGMNDSYELTQRLSTLTAAKNASPELLPWLAYHKLQPTTSARVDFQLRYALDSYAANDIIREFEKVRSQSSYKWPVEKAYQSMVKNIERTFAVEAKEFADLHNDSVALKAKRFIITAQRNLVNTLYLDEMIRIIKEGTDHELRLLTAETLGWYQYSYKKGYIVEQCKECLASEKDDAVKNELQKTINRLTQN